MSTNLYDSYSDNFSEEKITSNQASASDIIRQVMVIVALGLTIFVNYLSNALPLNGRTAGEISDSFPVRFTPAGYVFSIWG